MFASLLNDFTESKKYVNTLNHKLSCRVSSSSNINISDPPSSIDSITLAPKDRVLLYNQSTASENGIYIYLGAGIKMVRSHDTNTSKKMKNRKEEKTETRKKRTRKRGKQ